MRVLFLILVLGACSGSVTEPVEDEKLEVPDPIFEPLPEDSIYIGEGS